MAKADTGIDELGKDIVSLQSELKTENQEHESIDEMNDHLRRHLLEKDEQVTLNLFNCQGQEFSARKPDMMPGYWLDALKEKTFGSCHGTTIVGLRVGADLVIAVDSLTTVTMFPNDPNVSRFFEIMVGERENKFEEVIPGVYVTLGGDRRRIMEMMEYVRGELHKYKHDTEVEPDFDIVVQAASAYFRFYHRDPKMYHHVTTVHICGWIPTEKKFFIVEVGDWHDKISMKEQAFFGSGSGFDLALPFLSEAKYDAMDATTGVEFAKDLLIRSTLTHPHAGGTLRVYILRGMNYEIKYEGNMLDALTDPRYKSMFYDGKTMLVVCDKDKWNALSPQDLQELLKRFDQKATEIYWLGEVNDFLLYRVVLSSTQCCHDWFNTCEEFRPPVRCQTHTILRGSCQYYLGYATESLIARARQMRSYDDLAEISSSHPTTCDQ